MTYQVCKKMSRGALVCVMNWEVRFDPAV